MDVFELTLALLLVAVLLASLARRLDVPYPSLLAVAGAAIGFLPGAPVVTIEPDLALALFVAPVLLDAAFDTSPRDLRRHALPIASLALVAVLLTTAAVAMLGQAVAGLPLAAAIALGAIVAPPDAAAAAAVLSQFRPPRRLLAVLQGESLLNDATAIIVYRLAIASAAGSFVAGSDTPLLALMAVASVVAGYVLGRLYVLATLPIHDAASGTVLQFVTTFGVWLLAERLGLSAIITMVVYAMTLARYGPRRISARNRVSSYSVWETAVFVLNVLAFLIMGLQARPILAGMSRESLFDALALALAVLVTVIVVRIAWVLAYGAAARRLGWERDAASAPRDDILVGWCGMRGLVTLATAFALPADFPGRDPIVLSAFFVVLGTLVLQGLTLKPLLKLLRFEADLSVEDDVSRGRIAIMQAALDSLDGDQSLAAQVLRKQYTAARGIAQDTTNPQAATDFDELRLRAIARQRQTLTRLREDGEIGDEAFHRLEEEIDWAELDAAPAGRFQPLTT